MRNVTIGFFGYDKGHNQGIVTLKDTHSGEWIILPLDAHEVLHLTNAMKQPLMRKKDILGFFINILSTLNAEITQVVLDRYIQGELSARIIVAQGSEIAAFHAQPSHAIALAIRAGIPIYVAPLVWEEAVSRADQFEQINKFNEEDMIRDWLESLKPEDFSDH